MDFSRDHPHQKSGGSTLRWITIVKAFCPRRSQYKCQSRRKQETESHHNNWDGIISGNLEHREAPKIADRPFGPRNGPRWIRFFKRNLPWLAKPTAKAKTVQNCSDSTSLGNERVTTGVGRRPVANSPVRWCPKSEPFVLISFWRCPNSSCAAPLPQARRHRRRAFYHLWSAKAGGVRHRFFEVGLQKRLPNERHRSPRLTTEVPSIALASSRPHRRGHTRLCRAC